MNARQRRAVIRAWRRRVLASDANLILDRRRLTSEVLGRLQQYDLSTPTGATPGRVWRSDVTVRERQRWRMRHSISAMLPPTSTSIPRPVPRFAPPLWVVAEVTNERRPEGGWSIRWSLAVDDRGCLLGATSLRSRGPHAATDRSRRPNVARRARAGL